MPVFTLNSSKIRPIALLLLLFAPIGLSFNKPLDNYYRYDLDLVQKWQNKTTPVVGKHIEIYFMHGGIDSDFVKVVDDAIEQAQTCSGFYEVRGSKLKIFVLKDALDGSVRLYKPRLGYYPNDGIALINNAAMGSVEHLEALLKFRLSLLSGQDIEGEAFKRCETFPKFNVISLQSTITWD